MLTNITNTFCQFNNTADSGMLEGKDNAVLSGCYARNPKKINLSDRRVTVPLQHIDYKVDIVNGLANIMMNQIYYNPHPRTLQIDYFIPVLPDTCIYSLEATFNDTKIIRNIIENGQYPITCNDSDTNEESVHEFQQPCQNYKDCMKFQIGQVQPKSMVVVNVTMVQQMKVNRNRYYRLQIPNWTLPTHRQFAQQIQQTGSILVKQTFQRNFQLKLHTNRKIIDYHSPSHQLKILKKNIEKTKLKFNLSHPIKQKKDLVFQYAIQNCHLPSYAFGSNANSSTIMISFIPRFFDQKLNSQLTRTPFTNSQDKIFQSTKGEYIFILNGGVFAQNKEKFNEIKQAMIIFIKSLPQDSYFNIIYLEKDTTKIFEKSQRNRQQKVREAIQKIQQFRLCQQNVTIYPMLREILEQKIIQDYARHVYLFTEHEDNYQQILQLVKRNTKYCRVHTIGIGESIDGGFIEKCAQIGKGKYAFIKNTQNISEKIIQLLESSLTPIVTKTYLYFPKNNRQLESIIPNPKSIPYVMRGGAVNFYITGVCKSKQIIHIGYGDPITKQSCTVKLEIDPEIEGNVKNLYFIDKMAHFKVLQALQKGVNHKIDLKSFMHYKDVENCMQQAIKYSIKYQIPSQFTCFFKTKYSTNQKFFMAKEKQSKKVISSQQRPKLQISKNYEILKHKLQNTYREHKQKTKAIMQKQLVELKQKTCLFQQKQKQLYSNIKEQNPNGSWHNIQLVSKIINNFDSLATIAKQLGVELIVTKIIVNWLQKQHNSKQYSLIIKKALIWISKSPLKKQIVEEKLQKIIMI